VSAKPYTSEELAAAQRQVAAWANRCNVAELPATRWLATIAERDARIAESVPVLSRLVTAVDDLDAENGDRNLFVSSGCLLCTDGTTPNYLNTGLCAYHEAKGIVEGWGQ
jgi:hypothetical protein